MTIPHITTNYDIFMESALSKNYRKNLKVIFANGVII